MIVELKTLEKVIKEFEFEIDDDGDYFQRDKYWYIAKNMYKYFGREVEVFKNEYNSVYDYYLRNGNIIWCIHSLWFEPEEFIKKEEFEI